jgi:hypothetical protein
MISIYRDGETFGPFTMEQIVSMLNEGRVVPEDLCLTEGSEDWIPLSEVLPRKVVRPSGTMFPTPVAPQPKPEVQVIYQHKTSFDQIREIVAAKKEQIDQKLGPTLNKIHEEAKKDGYEDPVYLVWGVACLSAAVILMIITEGKTLLISAALVGAALITLYKYSKHPNDR